MNLTEKELRELDAWIAEHVMGWKLSTRGGSWRSTDPGWIDEKSELQFIQENWKPTTDPAAAMEVLKKCVPLALKKKRCAGIIFTGETSLALQMLEQNSYWTEMDSEAETIELAICLFAKKLFSK